MRTICEEQHRIASLIDYPVPLNVLINLIWRGVLGDTPATAVTQFMSNQSYITQVTLVLVPTLAVPFLIFAYIKHFPSWLTKQLQQEEVEKKEALETIQQSLTKKTVVSLKKKKLVTAYIRKKSRMKFREIDRFLPKAEP